MVYVWGMKTAWWHAFRDFVTIKIMKIVLLGSSEMLYSMIDGVLDAGDEIVGVMNWKYVRKNFFQRLITSDYTQNHIEELNLPVIKAKSANSNKFKRELLRLNPDVLLVGTWGEKIRKDIFDIPKLASVNIHPSLLPKYRGANPYSRAIMFGENMTGITFHLMTEKFDAGAILLQKEIEILKTDNAKVLKERICKEIKPMCAEFLKKIEAEIIVPIEQKEKDSSYFSHVQPDEIVVEPEKMTYEEIHNKIRGLAPWQSSYLLYRGEYFKIFDYGLVKKYIKAENRNLCLKTKDEKFVYFKNLRAYGKIKRFFTSTILNHLRNRAFTTKI